MTEAFEPSLPYTRQCEDALRQLYNFLDGELTTERRELIRHHLDECVPCFGAFDFEAELRLVIAQKCRDSVPEGLRRRIADAIARDHDLSAG